MHRTTARFRRCLEKLPVPIQRLSQQRFGLIKANPRHPSLRFKKVGKFWSARVGVNHRALAIQDGEDLIWVWIGTHDEYVRIIR